MARSAGRDGRSTEADESIADQAALRSRIAEAERSIADREARLLIAERSAAESRERAAELSTLLQQPRHRVAEDGNAALKRWLPVLHRALRRFVVSPPPNDASALPGVPPNRGADEFCDVTPAPLDERRLWGFYLDYPNKGSIAEAAAIDLWGWVIGRSSAAVAVEILSQERVIRRVPVDVERDDVAAVYPTAPNARRSGFGTTLRMHPGGERALTIQAVLKDQTRVPLAQLRLRTRWRSDDAEQSPLVSVIIPCYRQAHYLAEAIESVLVQTYPHVEIVVIDDGSPDNAGEIAARYPGIRCVRQPNRGVSEARNLGIRSSSGSFLVFLDADDRLRPEAIAIGLACFRRHPEVAFVSGRLRFIAADGATLYERQGHTVEREHYAAMLRRNYITAPCAAMCRRDVFESVTGFHPSLSVVADYEFYLRVLHQFPALSHDEEVAEYRRHGLGLSRRSGQMLREALTVLRSQRRHVNGDPTLARAYRTGIRFWKTVTADLIARQIRRDWQDGRRGHALRGLLEIRRCGWASLAQLARRGQGTRA